MNTTTIDLDVAKRVFRVQGVDTRGRITVSRRLKRGEVLRFLQTGEVFRRASTLGTVHVRRAPWLRKGLACQKSDC
jgi:hypothetical protein